MSNPSRKSGEETLEEVEAFPNPLDMADDKFDAKTRESLRHYRDTGLHLTHEEVKEWMRQRALGNRIPMPYLHT